MSAVTRIARSRWHQIDYIRIIRRMRRQSALDSRACAAWQIVFETLSKIFVEYERLPFSTHRAYSTLIPYYARVPRVSVVQPDKE
jgi:hypothetical protein